MSDARKNRGLSNGKGSNWYNAPLWDAIEKKKQEEKKKQQAS